MRTLLRYREVAETLGVCERTVARLVADGRLPVVRLGRKAVRIPLAAVEALARGAQAAAPTAPRRGRPRTPARGVARG